MQKHLVFKIENDKKLEIKHQHIVDRCMKGDTKAQFQLYELYHRAMYNTSLRIVCNAEDAEDLMQEAFMKAFDKLYQYKKEVEFGAWLKRIVVNHSINFIKKDKPFMEEFDNNYAKETNDETSEEIHLDMSKLKTALEQLS
ncbi:MAG: RNA polymerase sigma factor, partial [Bacteroidales bacterium]